MRILSLKAINCSFILHITCNDFPVAPSFLHAGHFSKRHFKVSHPFSPKIPFVIKMFPEIALCSTSSIHLLQNLNIDYLTVKHYSTGKGKAVDWSKLVTHNSPANQRRYTSPGMAGSLLQGLQFSNVPSTATQINFRQKQWSSSLFTHKCVNKGCKKSTADSICAALRKLWDESYVNCHFCTLDLHYPTILTLTPHLDRGDVWTIHIVCRRLTGTGGGDWKFVWTVQTSPLSK